MMSTAFVPMGWLPFFLDAGDRACAAEVKRFGILLTLPSILLPPEVFHDLLHEVEDDWSDDQIRSALAPWKIGCVRAQKQGILEPYPFLLLRGISHALVPHVVLPVVLWSNGRTEEI